MTREEAIRNLHVLSTVAHPILAEACAVGIAALREQEREDPKPLTLDELRQMDAPVWCVCKPLEGGDGYWCLCKNGTIITPAGSSYDVAEIPHWHFLRHKPKEEPHE